MVKVKQLYIFTFEINCDVDNKNLYNILEV